MFVFLPAFLHVVRGSLNVAQWTITSTTHDAVYTGRRRGLARELIASQVMNRNHEKIGQGKKVRGKMEGTRKRQKGREIGGGSLKTHVGTARTQRTPEGHLWMSG